MTRRLIDLTGKTFGQLKVVRFHESRKLPNGRGTQIYWLCRCVCGKELATLSSNLKKNPSCGCLRAKKISEKVTKHGHCRRGGLRTAEYGAWVHIRERCNNSNDKRYSDYGGRGIQVCKRWSEFSNFLEDMGTRPSPNHQIDRLDNDGDYTPDNCIWSTRHEQCRNKRNNVWITYKGRTLCLTDWARELGVKPRLLRVRHWRGWSEDEILQPLIRRGKRRRS
jgi:hypothetical protein